MERIRFGSKEVIATVAAILLALLVEWVQRHFTATGVWPTWINDYSRMGIPILLIMSAIYGPLVGVLTGFFGSVLIGVIFGGNIQYEEVAIFTVMGYLMGRYANKFEVREGNFRGIRILDFNAVQIMIGALLGGMVYPMILFILLKANLIDACRIGVKQSLGNAVLTGVAGTVILMIFSKVKNHRIKTRE